MQHTRRRSVFGLLASLLVLVLGVSAAGPVTGVGPDLPANIHPAVLHQIQARPGAALRVIVTKTEGVTGVEEAATAAGARVTAHWSMINAFAAELSAANLATLARIPGVRVVLNDHPVASTRVGKDKGQTTPALPYVMAVKAHNMWNEGFTGAGVTVAPGAQIISYMPYGALREIAPDNIVNTHYFRMGGTSMSAPVVSGVVALLLQARPDLAPDQVKWLLQTTARGYRDRPAGTPGIVNAMGAVEYKQPIGSANQGITPSALLDPAGGTIDYSNVLWGNVLWGNVLWGNVLWGNSPDYWVRNEKETGRPGGVRSFSVS